MPQRTPADGGTRRDWAAAQLLAEPARRRIYDAVLTAREPVTRDDVAAACGVGRSAAAFHLDALAADGLLAVDFARPPGRSGPGAGRPAKRYRAAGVDVAVTVPERRYDLAAEILLAGVRDARGDSARRSAFAAAAEQGRRVAASVRPGAARSRVCDALSRLGYEPRRGRGSITLRNCPFHAIVGASPEIVCGINLELITALVDELGARGLRPVLAPAPGQCCVQLLSVPDESTSTAEES